jgi:hypothetical protein
MLTCFGAPATVCWTAPAAHTRAGSRKCHGGVIEHGSTIVRSHAVDHGDVARTWVARQSVI